MPVLLLATATQEINLTGPCTRAGFLCGYLGCMDPLGSR